MYICICHLAVGKLEELPVIWNVTTFMWRHCYDKLIPLPHVSLCSEFTCNPSMTTVEYGSDFGLHDDVIKWKHFPRNWPFVRGIPRSPVNSPHKSQWRGALMFSLICVWINDWVNNREAGDLRRYRGHYDVNVISQNTSHRSSTRAICRVTFVNTLQKIDRKCFLYACIWHPCFTDCTQ